MKNSKSVASALFALIAFGIGTASKAQEKVQNSSLPTTASSSLRTNRTLSEALIRELNELRQNKMSPGSVASARGEGTVNGGGGNVIEGLVKNRIVSLFSDASSLLSEDVKRRLPTNPEAVYATLIQPKRFFPACAPRGSALAKDLYESAKMARVYPGYPNILVLACDYISLNEWTSMASPMNFEASLFFFHEGVRIAFLNSEAEDSYDHSMAIVSALKSSTDFEEYRKVAVMAALLKNANDEKGRCNVFANAGTHSSSATLFARSGYAISNTVLKSEFAPQLPLRAMLVDPKLKKSNATSAKEIAEFRDQVYNLSQSLHCF